MSQDLSLAKQALVVLTGPPLHGKSSAAKEIANLTSERWLDVDLIRHEFFPDESGRVLESQRESEVMVHAYRELVRRSASLIQAGKRVLLTGTFSRWEFKAPLLNLILSEQPHLPYLIFKLTAGREEIARRISERQRTDAISNITTLEQYEQSLQNFTDMPIPNVREIDTTVSRPAQVALKIISQCR